MALELVCGADICWCRLQDEPRRSRGVLGQKSAENRHTNFRPDCLQVPSLNPISTLRPKCAADRRDLRAALARSRVAKGPPNNCWSTRSGFMTDEIMDLGTCRQSGRKFAGLLSAEVRPNVALEPLWIDGARLAVLVAPKINLANNYNVISWCQKTPT
jgi:hypothetical protein